VKSSPFDPVRLEKRSYTASKARILAARAQMVELQFAVMKGNLHRAEDVATIFGRQYGAFRQRMLAIPSKTARLLALETDHAKIQRVLTDEIGAALAELHGYRRADFEARSRKAVRGNGKTS
jgi:hypothetical protein